jgi:hypothetical protein
MCGFQRTGAPAWCGNEIASVTPFGRLRHRMGTDFQAGDVLDAARGLQPFSI